MNTNKINIRKLEADLWESADLLRAGSKLTSSQYCMPVLALLFLRYAYSRYKMVEQEIMVNRPMRNGRAMPIEASDFQAKSALFLPKEAQFDYLVNLPDNIATAELKTQAGLSINSFGRAGFVMASSATDSANKDRDIREKLVNTGCVDVMVSVGNNFFYTLSLPCSLWFFDRNKSEEIRNKVLFIDARNYYTVVDRTLNEWSEWQLKNLNAIVWLYRGEREKYLHLIQEYQESLKDSLAQVRLKAKSKFADDLGVLNAYKDALKKGHKLSLEAVDKKANMKAMAKKKEQKRLTAEFDEQMERLDSVINTCEEAIWLTDKFGYEGKYQDVLGLCKIATIEEIADKNYSLTPGAYVGVAEAEDDGVEFAPRMKEIHEELGQLHAEANRLMEEIQKTWEGLV